MAALEPWVLLDFWWASAEPWHIGNKTRLSSGPPSETQKSFKIHKTLIYWDILQIFTVLVGITLD
jgi:hypothetical protein